MNIFQRIILVLGAATLVAAILTTPYVIIVQGTYYVLPAEDVLSQLNVQPMILPATAAMRAVGVIGATVLLFFALKGIELKKRAKKAKPKK